MHASASSLLPNQIFYSSLYADHYGITIEIGADITSIGKKAFSGFGNLESVVFVKGSAFTTISAEAFRGAGMESITIPSSVTTIGDRAFDGCEHLAEVIIPIESGLETIGYNAFNYCGELTSITIPAKVSVIDTMAFDHCEAMTDVYCYAEPSGLTWRDASKSFKTGDVKTVCHVPTKYYNTYVRRFGSNGEYPVNVRFESLGDPTGMCGENAVWTLSDTNGDEIYDRLVISGSGDMADYEGSQAPWYLLQGRHHLCQYRGGDHICRQLYVQWILCSYRR